jgi:hypothetical protein
MKREIKYAVLVAGILAVAFLSCKKEQQQTLYMGYDYFPNNKGHYVIYQCDSIIVNPFKATYPQFDTFKYQIKEVIDSIFPNNSGQPTQRIVRYKRTDTTIPWTNIFTIEKVWTGTLLPNIAVRLEDNYDYVKLVFPMSLNEQWNGNVMNTITGQGDYQYATLNTPAIVNGTRFDSTLTVMQYSAAGLDFNQYYYEQYATGVGLVYKEVVNWSTNNLFFTAPPPLDSANYGTIFYSETYLSSGNQ